MDAESLVKSCPLFKATFFETMRVYTAGTSSKKVYQDLTLNEGVEDLASFGKVKPQTYHIKAGSFLIIPAKTMQKDPRVWKDPNTFDPRRFLVEDKDGFFCFSYLSSLFLHKILLRPSPECINKVVVKVPFWETDA
jgi:hypothetical protein